MNAKTTAPSNPLKAIRAKCLDCMCNQQSEVKLCPSESCPLYPFRLGKNPFRQKRTLSEAQKERMVQRFAEGKARKNNVNNEEKTVI